MWELRYKLSHGRLSMRRISLLATTLVMALFVTTFGYTHTALAADATRTGTTVSYDNKTFTQLSSSDTLPSGLPTGTSGYEYVDSANNKTHFILTTGNPAQANSGQYVYYDGLPTTNFSNPSPPKKVSIANGAPNSAESLAGAPTTCDGSLTGGIGWILCPVVNFLASGMDHLYDILSSFLEVRPVQTDSSSSLFRMWAIVRDIANVCFVIAFLVIVYSQITSLGISNYNVKRMLPRLIAAAILVNISYWVSSLLVDVSNLLGYSIHNLFVGMFSALNTSGQYKEVNWTDLSGFILSGGTIGTLAAFGGYAILANGLGASLILLIPVLVGVLLAALIAFLVMALRQALVVCLVIVSPLAFVAYLLPNTEKYFEKWKDLFLTMLMLFPIFSMIFGASKLAGLAIIQNANSLVTIIIGMAVIIAPVVVTPMLIKFSGGLIGRIAGMVNNPRRGLTDRTRNWAQGRAQEEKAKILAGQGRKTWANNRTQAIDRRRRNRAGWKKAYEAMADNNFAATTEGQALEARSRQTNIDKQRIDNAFGRSAVGRTLEYESRLANYDKQAVENEFNDSHLGHQADRVHRTVELAKHRIESDHEASWNNAVRTDATLLRESMDARSSQVRAELAKGKLDKLNAEVAAQGENTEYILNLRGLAPQDQAGLLNIARDIKTGTFDSYIEARAKGMADRKLNETNVQMLTDNTHQIDGTNVVEYAAGIMGKVGQRSVVSQAKIERSKFLIDDVKNIESTLDYDISSNPELLFDHFQNAETDAERVAYTSIMAKRGGPGAAKLREMVREMDARLQAGTITHGDLNDYKELVLAQNAGIMGLGKDLEFFFTNAAFGADYADPTMAGKVKTFDEITNDAGTWANLSADSFSRMNIVNQLHGLKILAHKNPAKYQSLVENLKRSPSAMANMKDDVVAAINRSPDDPYWTTGPYNAPTRDELTEFEEHVLTEPPRTTFGERPDVDPTKDAAYWQQQYENLRNKTEASLNDARSRGINY